ncbi:peroxide stress protein YaaA [Halomonas halocynthiae]|uniref:peroxide stress protein YaaA n=1 Tax=Halomonas halocynthiae TaxID=176290 RepID=UPI0003FC0909|nr:peroxide stress protein YaaA [Halomonas halocynthiae]
MLSVISPAKKLDFDTPASTPKATQPDFLDCSQELIEVMREYSPQQLSELMKVSDRIAGLNAARFADWQRPFTAENAKPAAQAFQGDVYVGLEAERFDDDENNYAQSHLRILSGLYGLLRPLDLIQPYRLEMGTKVANPRGEDLYAYWKNELVSALASAIADSGSNVLVNLASNEYFKAVDTKRLDARILTPVFKDEKNGQYKIISFYAKKARGLMAGWIIRERINSPEALSEFDVAGYRFSASESSGDKLVFCRAEQDR